MWTLERLRWLREQAGMSPLSDALSVQVIDILTDLERESANSLSTCQTEPATSFRVTFGELGERDA